MSNQDLSASLETLLTDLRSAPELDEQSSNVMRELIAEIQSRIIPASSENQASQDISLADRLKNTLEDFEIKHPQLVANLNSIAERLSDMGI